ncbi:MAG TPA: BON domain-containing protein [Bryobacteraceae bacterium]|nr:BON domain-containing protein [Bryobacteraceae bacterium]
MAETEKTRDDEIALNIREALRLDNDVPDGLIDVQVQDGIATLEGTVESELQKEIAEADTKKIKGVREVINRIVL